ncbi:MAG: CBS domain-containing protein [Pyrinomonadaceae bacterium]
MQVKDVMTSNPMCCVPETSLAETARMMIEFDCGEIPVVENMETKIPVGVVTDRDIVCRTIGKGINPMDLAAGEIMSQPVAVVTPEMSFEECCGFMEEKQIRRVPVVDAGGAICGIVAMADIAKYGAKKEAGEVVQEVLTEIGAPSNVR